MDLDKLFSVTVQAGAFISSFAAIAAGIIMARVNRKFNSGILASGFKVISIGVFLLAIGIVLDAAQVVSLDLLNNSIVTFIIGLRQIFFVLGTFIIVIGTKKTVDKLEALTR